jgi:signal transduction histidine kinase
MIAMTDDQLVQQAYKPFHDAFRVSESIVALKVALILVPAGALLDYIVYPDKVVVFFAARLLCDLVLAILLFLCYTEYGKRNMRTIMFSYCFTGQLVFSFMIFSTDGASSTYYAALNLVILAIGLIIPFSFSEAAVFCIGTIALYVVTCLLHPGGDIVFALFFNNLFFLSLTSVISLVALYFTEKRRYNEFKLSYDLERRNQELAELDEYKSRFFANISHELRTPLTLILGPIQDLLKSPQQLAENVATLLHTARDNGLRLLNLVNSLLDLIQLEEGKTKFEFRNIEVNSFLVDMRDAITHLADTRKISLVSEFDKSALDIRADHNALERIFLNLLSNALKFTPDGGTVWLRSMQVEDAAVITISDTGIGISVEELPFIFDRFRQADTSTTRKYTGTGIGLALVKELTENMGGSITATSEVGNGTCMKLSFPLLHTGSEIDGETSSQPGDSLELLHEAAGHMAMLPIEEPEGVYEQSITAADQPKVLVVDDEPGMRRYLVDMLSSEYHVLQARNGAQGLKMAQQDMPDLMVLDLMLPEIDGLEVCRRLKAQESTRAIKIILLTARVDEHAKLTALENGADDFLTKPFGRTELLTRMRNLNKTLQLEMDLRANNDALSDAIENLKSLQASLIQSEKLNALGSLSAGLLHEINNPLNYTLTAVQLLQMEPALEQDPEIKGTIDDIFEGMRRIKDIVSDLRAFAYPSEADKQTSFHFQNALDTALRFTGAEIRKVNINQQISKPDLVMGSHSHVVQVLVNLLLNSVKAIEERDNTATGVIDVGSRVLDDRYYVSVLDNGTGMDEDTMKHVFDPFFTTREVGEGMGMGLSICHTIIANHGGKLTVDSADGEWTKFTFDLKLGE